MAEETWDLADLLAERKQPEDTVEIYVNELASFTKSQLVKATENLKGEELAKVEAKIADVDKVLEQSKYTIHITAIPTRMREDLADKALSEFPMKLDYWGHDDAENARKRQRREDILIWNAQVAAIDNPRGAIMKNMSPEMTEDFKKSISISAQNAITKCITDLTVAAEEYSVKSKNVDF